MVAEEVLHARPAAQFVKTAKGSDPRRVIKAGAEANAEGPLKLMPLKARHGDRLVIRAESEGTYSNSSVLGPPGSTVSHLERPLSTTHVTPNMCNALPAAVPASVYRDRRSKDACAFELGMVK